MERGLAARLSPNEEIALLRAQTKATLDGLNKIDVGRLVSLKLISLGGDTMTLTPLGRQRIVLVGEQHRGADGASLPPARAAAQKLREAELMGHFDLTPLKLASPPRPILKTKQKARF